MKIQYQNKKSIDLDPSIPEVNKVTADNMNEIKQVTNANADTLDDLSKTVADYTNGVDKRLGEIENTTSGLEESLADLSNNTYTKTETDNILSNYAQKSEIPTDLSQLSNDTTKFVNETQLNNAINTEVTNRENADINLQNQIDAITSSSDVVDIVGTYQELQNYDTQHLGDNDIIKVLQDSTHNNATSYFRWDKQTETWIYIGSQGPFYTKGETDELLTGYVQKVVGKGLSTNDFTDTDLNKLNSIEANAQVNKIEGIQVNGIAKPIDNKTVNIEVPTKTSDLTNDSDFTTKAYVDGLIGDIETLLYNINRGSGV